jgi:hypothetical protein
MEPLEQLRAKIKGFPGYDTDLERRRSDEYVRSYLGEALTEFAQRENLPADQQQRIADLLLRVGFANARDFATRHIVAAKHDAHESDEVATADVATVELADRAASLDANATSSYLNEVVALLDARETVIRAVTSKTT